MSHTNHRSGSVESLKNDFPFITLGAANFNRDGIGPKLGEATKIYMKHNPINHSWVGVPADVEITPDTPSIVFKDADDKTLSHALFGSKEDLIACLKDLKEADLGVCAVVSGLFADVHECCHEAGLTPHTVNTSLGIMGRTELLPEPHILDITTMCGHGYISFELVKDCVKRIKAGKMTAAEAADKVCALCKCGIFNPIRAERIFEELVRD